MSTHWELDRVTKVVASAVGEPGQRTFYVQVRQDETLVTLLVEKQQVALMSQLVEQLLARMAAEGRSTAGYGTATSVPEPLELEPPLESAFRVGQIGLGFDAARDLFLLQFEEFVPPEEGADDDEDDGDDEDDDDLAAALEELEELTSPEELAASGMAVVRAWVNRDQLRALAKAGASAVAAGRPLCPMCGTALDGDGRHFCPGSNGHRPGAELG